MDSRAKKQDRFRVQACCRLPNPSMSRSGSRIREGGGGGLGAGPSKRQVRVSERSKRQCTVRGNEAGQGGVKYS